MERLKNTPGFDKVVEDMAQHWTKFRGGKFQLKYATKLIDEGVSIKFEVSNLSDNLKRIYDIEVKKIVDGRLITKNLELKNWNDFYPETIKNQLIKDLQKMKDLGDIQWIFNKTNGIGDMQILKNKILKSLKKADGTPIEEMRELFETPKFSSKISEWTKENPTPKKFLEWLDKPENFEKLFKITE